MLARGPRTVEEVEVSAHGLVETVRGLLCLFVDVHIRHRERYSKRLVRVP